MTKEDFIETHIGYRAFNGYVFTAADARAYANAVYDPHATKIQVHKTFNVIIGF